MHNTLDKNISLLKRYMNNANRLTRIKSVVQVVYFINDFIATGRSNKYFVIIFLVKYMNLCS